MEPGCGDRLGRSGRLQLLSLPLTPTSQPPALFPRRYICKALAGRLSDDPAVRQRFADPAALLLGQRSSVLVAPLGPHGSLQDLLNAYLAQRQASAKGEGEGPVRGCCSIGRGLCRAPLQASTASGAGVRQQVGLASS